MKEEINNEIIKSLEKVDEYVELTGREKADIIADLLDDGILNLSNKSKDSKMGYQDSVHQGDNIGNKVGSQTFNDVEAIGRMAVEAYQKGQKKNQDNHSNLYPPIKHPRPPIIQKSTNNPPRIVNSSLNYNSNQQSNTVWDQSSLLDLDSPGAEAIIYAVWLFTGMFGGHRMLLGHWGIAVLYLLTAGGFFIGWITDFPKLPHMISKARTAQRKLKNSF